jgi:hypothetical protein
MQRIATLNKAVDLFGAGKHGFKNGNLAGGIAPTEFDAEWCNGMQEELSNLVENSGQVLDPANRNQVRKAIDILVRRRAAATAAAAGTADALIAGFVEPLTAPGLVDGVRVTVRALSANATATPTFAPDGLPAKIIVKLDNLPLQPGDIAGPWHVLDLKYDAGLDRWVLLNPAPSGRLLAVRVFTSSSVYTATVGTRAVRVTVQGGGGGGGGSAATTASQVSASPGGNSGACAQSYLTAGFSGGSIVVGAGGAAGAVAGAGGAGGASSFGAVSAPGGAGAPTGAAAVPPVITIAPVNGAAAAGGNVYNGSSGIGMSATCLSTGAAQSGDGANSIFGSGPRGNVFPAAGGAASNYGCGGAGALSGASDVGRQGGVGAQGLVIIEEFS